MSYKEALIRFSFDNTSQSLVMSLAGSASGLLIYGVDIVPVPSVSLKYDMRRPLVDTLKAMQDDMSKLLQVYYPTGEKESFDTTVVSMINGIDTSSSTVSKDFIEKMKVRKAYARYYYDMFRKRTVEYDETKNKDAVILTSLVSYYFMKRLVHVFVMCTIYEKISSMTVSSSNSSSSQPIFINNTTTNSVSSNDFAAERQALEAKIANLEAGIKNESTLSESSNEKLKDMEANYKQLLDNAQQKIVDMEAQVNNYRELLLKSTTMIFKLDEIPNVLTK
jgi:hypothetical protein